MTTAGRILRPSAAGSPRTIGPLLASILVCLGGVIVGIASAETGIIIVAAIAALIAALAIAVRPDSATLVVVAILYSNAAAIAVQRYDVPYFAGAAFPLLLIVPFAYHIVIRRQPIVIAVGLPWLIGFFIVVTMGTVFALSADPDRAIEAFFTFVVEGVLIYTVLTNVIRSMADLRLTVWVLLLVGGALGALSVHQQATESFKDDYGGFAQVSEAALAVSSTTESDDQPRLSGPIGEKNRYAQVMVVLLPLGLFRFWSEKRLPLRLLAGLATAFIAFGAVLTFSRGAALGFAITIVLMTALRYIRPAQFVALALGTAVVFAIQPTYLDRLLTIEAIGGATSTAGATQVEDDSFRKRANEAIAAILVFADYPVLGVGRGVFPHYYGDYADEVGIVSENEARQAHNLYAGILAETGALGGFTFFGIFGATLVALAKVRRRCLETAPEYAAMATAFFLAVVAYLTTGLFLHLSYERYLWTLLALAASAAYLGSQAAPDVPVNRPVRPARVTAGRLRS